MNCHICERIWHLNLIQNLKGRVAQCLSTSLSTLKFPNGREWWGVWGLVELRSVVRAGSRGRQSQMRAKAGHFYINLFCGEVIDKWFDNWPSSNFNYNYK